MDASSPAGATVAIRRATAADAAVVAGHRAAMFTDMGRIAAGDAGAPLRNELIAASRTFLEAAIPAGEYVGWLAHPGGEPGAIVAGAGVQCRRTMPHPPFSLPGELCGGRQAIVINVYTEPPWRRRGIAERLMREIIAWARDERLDALVLHASEDGRPLYERLGFAPTNEMRFQGALAEPDGRFIR